MNIFKMEVMVLMIPLVLSELYSLDCKSGCTLEKLNNSVCDIECNFEDCSYDNGNCSRSIEEFCQECLPSKDDGVCDVACDIFECGYDGMDCIYECGEGCRAGMLGNGICEQACYKEDCGWDSNDCQSLCHMKCPQFFIGDGICDSECNNKECDYDNGDCGEEDSDDYIVTVMTAVGFGLIAVTFCG